VPIASAAIDGDDGERRNARRDGLRQSLLDTPGHHACGVLALAVQRDHRPQRRSLPGWAGDRPVCIHATARRGYE
jgi:hypothetical protein